MDELLKVLRLNAMESPEDLARQLNVTPDEIRAKIRDYSKQGVIRGYHAIVNEEALELDIVRAVIEVRITPEREGGFDRLASRIGRFDEVDSLYLMSGGYDLLVFVSGRTLKEVAAFVAAKLSTMEGVLSTATHFLLKTYKEHGILMEAKETNERLQVSP
ncbi:MAG: Lrp/AsnC family transcriptional regulator [Kiritimatiellia bacterium]